MQMALPLVEFGRSASTPRARYTLWPELYDQLVSGDWEELEELCRFSLLALDDVGAEADKTGLMVQKLIWLTERRQKMWTLLATNIPPDHWEAKFTRRGASRLLRDSEVVDVSRVSDWAA